MESSTARRCGAKKRQGEGTCAQAPGWGTSHPGYGPCKLHGGSSPSLALVVAEQQARELFGKLTTKRDPIDDPLSAYATLAAQVMDWLDHMNRLLDDVRHVEVTSKVQGEQVAAKIQLYERAMDRANTVLSSYARLNIDARLAAITEAQAKIVMRAIEAAIAATEAPPDKAAAAKTVAARHLRAVA